MARRMPARVQVGRFLRMVSPAALVDAGGVLALYGFLIYKITHPAAVQESVNPSHYLLPSVDVTWTAGGLETPGWWIPGRRGAPGILLAPGYGMSRADALSLAAVLHADGFNLLIYAERGSGAAPRLASSLGVYEATDMLTALEFLKSRSGVDVRRIGIWGVDVGARAALKTAADHPEVVALAVDGAYEDVGDFVCLRVREEIGSENRILESGCRQILRVPYLSVIGSSRDPIAVQRLSNRSVLFIQGENRKDLARLSAAVYEHIQPQKEMLTLPTSRVRLMNSEELKSYDRQVANFFHLNLARQ